MTSFKKRLLIILIGVVLLNFLLIGSIFNILIGEYIKSQAEKELVNSVYSMQGVGVREAIPITPDIAPKSEAAMPGASASGKTFNPEIPRNEDVLSMTRVVPATKSVISTSYIIFDKNKKEVIFPLKDYMSNNLKNTVDYLTDYIKTNRKKFEDTKLVKTDSGSSTYYATLFSLSTPNAQYDILAYTDITPVQNFSNKINYVLLLVMGICGIITVLAGIRMYGGLNKAINDLCRYAEQIGHGKFNEERKQQYKYIEFNNLAKSMSDMSKKIETYDKQKQMFFQNVSHELRTPLMSIQGYAEGISQQVFDDTGEAADVIVMQSEKMLSLINELLYVSRMDNGLLKLNINRFDARDLLAACIDSVKIIAQREGKTLNSDLPKDGVFIEADEEQLIKAFVNILINCIRYAKTSVNLSCTAIGNEIKIEITDDGKGIALKDLPHIFERFYMGENGKSGLGLSLTKEIIERHGGRILVENTGAGAKFTVFLFLADN